MTSRRSLWLRVLSLLPAALATTASASAHEPVGPIAVPADAPRSRDPVLPVLTSAPATVYVNFDGAELEAGWDDAAADRTQIDEMVGTFAPFGDDATERAAIMQSLREDWAAYDVQLTDERPETGPYTMVMVGPTNPFGPATLGMAPLDCGDSQTPSNVAFAFYGAGDGRSAVMTATTIGHEIAHTVGLEHVDEPTALMHSFNVGGDPEFRGDCLPIVGDVVCGAQHEQSCGVADEQNAHEELMALFGPAVPDGTPPQVGIVAPLDGELVREGAGFDVEVEADDAQGIARVLLWDGGDLVAMDEGRPFGWHVTAPEAGEHTFVVEAIDRAGNSAKSREIVVIVQPTDTDAPGALVPTHPEPVRDAAPDEADEDEGDAPRDAEDWREEDADVGLGCAVAPAPRGPWWATAGVLALGLRRRRALLGLV